MHNFLFIVWDTSNDRFDIETTSDLKHELIMRKRFAQLQRAAVKLLYYEHYTNASTAFNRKKELKASPVSAIHQLIKSANPHKEDLAGMFY